MNNQYICKVQRTLIADASNHFSECFKVVYSDENYKVLRFGLLS